MSKNHSTALDRARGCGAGIGAICVLALLAASRSAAADEVPKVTITASGPDAAIPAGHTFYLAGIADKTVQSAQVFVIRKGSRGFLYSDKGPACPAVKRALAVDQPGKTAVTAGVHRVREVYPAATALRENPVLASARWERKDVTGEPEYKLLVPGDASFFQAGYAYCLFVETSRQKSTTHENELRAEIDRLVKSLQACDAAPMPAAQSVSPDCESTQFQAYEARIDALAAKAVGSPRSATDASAKAAKFRVASDEAVGHAVSFDAASRGLAGFANPNAPVVGPVDVSEWGNIGPIKTPSPEASGGSTTRPEAQRQLRTNHLAHATATLLAWNRGLVFYPPGGRTGFFAGTLPVGWVRIDADGKSIEVASSKAAKPSEVKKLDVTTDKLEVAPGVTLYDLILLTRNRIAIAGIESSIAELVGTVRTLPLDDAWSNPQIALVDGAHTKVGALAAALESFDVKSDNVGEETPSAVRAHLGAFVHDQPPPTDTPARRLASLMQKLNALSREKQSWDQAKKQLLVTSIGKVTYEAADPIATEIEFTESTWVFSYLTPVLGYAQVRSDGDFALFYVAVQLHFVPNPGNDVLWSNGFASDWSRSFALELGFAPNVSSFGPDKRFAGYSGFPPVFGGVALHIIPYTSLSFGGVLLDRKGSSLAEERPRATVKPYLGLNVQFNIPEYVREASKVDASMKVTSDISTPK